MPDLEKYSGKNLEVVQSTITESVGPDGVSIGDIFIKPTSSYIAVKVINIFFKDNDYANQDPELKIIITYARAGNYDLSEWSDVSTSDLRSFKYDWVQSGIRVKRGESLTEYIDKSKKIIAGEFDVESLNDNNDDDTNTETSLISKNSKTNLLTLQNDLEDKKKKAELIQAFVSIEMEKKKRELDKIRQKLNGVIEVFKKKIIKIMKVITTIELYLGIDEELFQIQEGELAPKDTPISFRQAVLYMDEEIGHWENGGLDFTNIDWFDQWLVKDNNYKKLLPEEKGLVVFRPRRYEKDYGDPRYNSAMNQENKYRTYLLIRNGECLYRVYTENIVILPRLFPKRDELQKLMDEIQKENLSSWSEEKKQENVEDLVYQYKKRAILLQGLVDRTEVFHPLPVDEINIFDMSNLEGKVNFIYDDEYLLPSGRLSFWDWHKEINGKIGKGSRILLTGFHVGKHGVRDRIYYYCNEIPDRPPVGIYEVEEYLQEEKKDMKMSDFEKLKKVWDERGIKYEIKETRKNQYHINYRGSNFPRQEKSDYIPIYEDGVTVKSAFIHLTILYNPKDEVYGPWGTYDPHDRKKRIRLRIYPSDDFVLNYDQISLDDIEFYLTSRVDRPNYLKMLPMLNDMKKWRIQELENEKNFTKLIYSQVYQNFKGKSEEYIYDKIWETIDWWKYKNMWKRPIDKDDTKALRMIVKKLIGDL